MKAWQEEDIQSLLTVPSEKELFARVTEVAQDLGFEYCAYGLRVALPVSNPRVALYNNYPDTWQERYKERDYLAVDPTVKHGLASSRMLLWSETVYASTLEFWEDAWSFGLRHGWAMPIRDAHGLLSMTTFARSQGEISQKELSANLPKMYWLAQVAHVGMTDRIASQLLPQMDVRLSDREVEVLRWTGDGKTSNDVADILGISERTVNFHINNAMLKLGASNKTAAAVRAAMLGLL